MDLQHKSSTPLRAKDIIPHPIYIYILYIYIIYILYIYVFLFNKTISLFYSLFVFCLYYKIIGLSSLNLADRGLAGRGLTQTFMVWVGPGPKF